MKKKKENTRIYYYSRLYPEFGVKSFVVKDELYLVGKDVKVLEYLVADYDLETDTEGSERWIRVYAPYEDQDLLVYDKSISKFGSDYFLCFNEKKLRERHQESFDYYKHQTEQRLKRFWGD